MMFFDLRTRGHGVTLPTMRAARVRSRVVIARMLAFAALVASPALAMEPNQIVLVVNNNVPASRELAEFYARTRGIPDGRIIEVSLPAPDPANPPEGMPFAQFDGSVATPVREFLRKNALDTRVTCLVTFWGMPLRIDRKVNTPAENEEAETVTRDLARLRPALEAEASEVESIARRVKPSFAQANQSKDLDQLAQRIDVAINVSVAGLLSLPNGPERRTMFAELIGSLERLTGGSATVERLATPTFAALVARPITSPELTATREKEANLRKTMSAANLNRREDRERVRKLSQSELGIIGSLQILLAQQTFVETKETESALDSELALIWWGPYPRFRWQGNPLNWRLASAKNTMPTLMVMRLDAPSDQIVRDIITTSVEVEKRGLTGQLALDARGKPPSDPYGVYDQTIRNLARLAQARTKLRVTLDNKEELFAPGSVDDVAIYCGWYSLRNYVPGCHFNRGAVGFHIASSELVSLRSPHERGWVHGLLQDGVVGTLGPVAEPYLHSFPPADEFFPLLLTGKLTMAEVYWRSNPLVSWMNTFIGDPLYTPYKVNPLLAVKDLPDQLQMAFQPMPTLNPSTQPTNEPTTMPETETPPRAP